MSISSLTAPDSRILPNTVAALSVLATSAGFLAVLNPLEAIPQFGLSYPVKNDKNSMDLALALTRIYGIRNASIGLVSLALWWNGRGGDPAWRRALGWAFVANLGTPLIDGMMCEWQGKTSGWKHWIFIPVAAAIGAGLLI